MTPGARVAAAIDILDTIRAGTPAEQALTGWARASRFAGSKDRAAVRDHVFDVLRARRSLGDGDGRALMLALALRENWNIEAVFSGEGHAPAPPATSELVPPPATSVAAACDIPDWLWPLWSGSLGERAEAVARVLQTRAPVFLRVNLRRADRAAAARALAQDGITSEPHPQIATCLLVTAHHRRIKTSGAYADGLVELQDAASQWAVAQMPLAGAARVLDYCAGGGGKALALADACDAVIFAHDIAPQRMRDLPTRAARAGVEITQLAGRDVSAQAPYDLVLCDAPCSGAGTWRRAPEAKWDLTPSRLDDLVQLQDEVLDTAQGLVGRGGTLVYATCSVLEIENSARIQEFVERHNHWQVLQTATRLPDDLGDGFFVALLRNNL